MSEYLKNVVPKSVNYVFTKHELEERLSDILEKKSGYHLELSVSFNYGHQIFILFLDEESVPQGVYDQLEANDIDPYDGRAFRDALLYELFDTTEYIRATAIKIDDDTHFSVVMEVPFKAFQKHSGLSA